MVVEDGDTTKDASTNHANRLIDMPVVDDGDVDTNRILLPRIPEIRTINGDELVRHFRLNICKLKCRVILTRTTTVRVSNVKSVSHVIVSYTI